MATAQVLKATHTVGDRVRGVDGRVLDVGNRVAAVDDKVVSVDNRVEGVEVRVASVDDNVKAVDDKVAVVIDGAQSSSIGHQEIVFNFDVPRRKAGEGSHTANSNRHRSSETFVISLSPSTPLLGVLAQPSSQGTKYERRFQNGSRRQIRLLITTLRVALTTKETPSGFSKAASSRNGNLLDLFYGSTENVCFTELSILTNADGHLL